MFSSLFRNDLRVIKEFTVIRVLSITHLSGLPLSEEAEGKPYTFDTGQSEEISHETSESHSCSIQ
jgi:hypothetical protein